MNKKGLFIVVLLGFVLCCPAFLTAQEGKKNKEPSQKVQKGIEYLYTGKRDKAREFFSGAAASDPGDGDAWFYLGLSYYDENKLIIAKDYFEKAKELYRARGDKEGQSRAQDFVNILTCGPK
ncbi:MAG: hypothetical protein M0R20_01775 [Candidatus Omnitrophica bacterium]|nr:hypothetical protein [Candidatus Omnitrophota bacterium]